MFGIDGGHLIVLPIILLGFAPFEAFAAGDEHASAWNRIAAARSVALSLRTDASMIASAARKGPGVRLSTTQTNEIRQHIDTAHETAQELQEVQEIASLTQKALISRITPLLRDLARSAESMLDHLNGKPKQARRQVDVDYLSAHEEIAKHSAMELVAAIDATEQKSSRTPVK